MVKSELYFETCDNSSMISCDTFLKNLIKLQSITKKIDYGDNDNRKICTKCKIDKHFILGNIVWNENIIHKIEAHKMYPSEYFIKVITNLVIFMDTVLNPPMQIKSKYFEDFSFVKLSHNKLLIIDALLKQGSKPHYIHDKQGKKNLIYSEHSGALSIYDGDVNNIIVSAETDRVELNDPCIFLPKNTPILSEYNYIFHTHPNTSKYAGRIKDNIIYEFPSANDIFNFIKFYNEAIIQASIIVAPEGTYVVRPLKFVKKIPEYTLSYDKINKFIHKLELEAVNKFRAIQNISDPDVFHKNVGHNLEYIIKFNKFIKQLNVFIEFYPRIKIKDEWYLREIFLPYIDK